MIIFNARFSHLYSSLIWCLNVTASDYYNFDDLLTSEEQAIRKKVRECAEKELAPIVAEVFSLFH